MDYISKRPTRNELQQMMELPHGQVEQLLKKSGLWNYAADPDLTAYWVQYDGKVIGECTGTGMIHDTSKEEAPNLAKQIDINEVDWDLPYNTIKSDIQGMCVMDIYYTVDDETNATDAEVHLSGEVEETIEGSCLIYATDMIDANKKAHEMKTLDIDWEMPYQLDCSVHDIDDVNVYSIDEYTDRH